MNRQAFELGEWQEEFLASLSKWERNGNTERLWGRDAGLWTASDESRWLGWLDIVGGDPGGLEALAAESRASDWNHVVVLGMGGSSLCPEVLSLVFGPRENYPELLVLDSTVPAQIETLTAKLDLRRTLFLVASKSGSTAEPNAFERYYHHAVAATGIDPGPQFVAITDPGSALETLAREKAFGHLFHGEPSIGGRYSALSHFGMVPAALMGLDVRAFYESAASMVAACRQPEKNPGVELGVLLGILARNGRDKVTFLASSVLAPLGAWIEQLVAESTGKHGKGIVPVDREKPGPPDAYGDDRVFVRLAMEGETQPGDDRLVRAGHPLVTVRLRSTMDLGQEFFRWEVATAVAGAVLELNPFDQPDVEASKVATRALLARYADEGTVAAERPSWESDELRVFTDEVNREAIGLDATAHPRDVLKAHLERAGEGDYVALNAYIEMNPANDGLLQEIRGSVRDARGVATTVGYGPRFLHSTGQLHKGGPNSGVFIQITADDAKDVPIPGERHSFGVLKQFQAGGDLNVLYERKRRAVRVHLGEDVTAGLQTFSELMKG